MAKRFSVVTEYYDRFRDVGAMEEDGDGDYVLYSDYAALLARAEAAEKERDRYKMALESIKEYWNRDNNEKAMHDACWHAVDTAHAALNGGGE